MAVQLKNGNGETITLYNPAERGKKYCNELHTGVNQQTGDELRDTQKAFRSGYLKARQESAKIYCAQNNIPSKAKSARSANPVKNGNYTTMQGSRNSSKNSKVQRKQGLFR